MREIILQDIDVTEDIKLTFNINHDYLSILKKYNIKKIRIYQNEIAGPAYGMIQLIEEVYKASKFENVADMFSGALGYSQVCLALGAQRIDAYDLQIRNYYPENDKLYVYQKDLLKTEGSVFSKYDLLIVEPPKKYHLLFLNALPNVLHNALILFRIGFTKYSEHIEDCRKICESKFSKKKWEMIHLHSETYIKIEC